MGKKKIEGKLGHCNIKDECKCVRARNWDIGESSDEQSRAQQRNVSMRVLQNEVRRKKKMRWAEPKERAASRDRLGGETVSVLTKRIEKNSKTIVSKLNKKPGGNREKVTHMTGSKQPGRKERLAEKGEDTESSGRGENPT